MKINFRNISTKKIFTDTSNRGYRNQKLKPNNMQVRIQSTFNPPERLSPVDWELYLKLRSTHKIKLVRRLNDKLNQVLTQSMNK